jgi:hypothetical protein
MTWRATIAIILISILCAAAPVAAQAAESGQALPAPVRDGEVSFLAQIKNQNSKQCLLVRGSAPDARAVQTPCANFNDQIWKFRGPYMANETEYWMIANANSGQCLVARGNAPDSPVVQAPCNEGYVDQFWTHPRRAVNNYFEQMRNYNSGLCLVVRTTTVGAPAVQTNCSPTYSDSKWTRLPVTPPHCPASTFCMWGTPDTTVEPDFTWTSGMGKVRLNDAVYKRSAAWLNRTSEVVCIWHDSPNSGVGAVHVQPGSSVMDATGTDDYYGTDVAPIKSGTGGCVE